MTTTKRKWPAWLTEWVEILKATAPTGVPPYVLEALVERAGQPDPRPSWLDGGAEAVAMLKEDQASAAPEQDANAFGDSIDAAVLVADKLGFQLPLSVVSAMLNAAHAAPEQEPVTPIKIEVHNGCVYLRSGPLEPGEYKLYPHADPSEVAQLRKALQHIVKTVGQSRSSTRRLRWIEQRAQFALEGREYDDTLFDLPKNAGNTAERATQQSARLRHELEAATLRADAAERELHEWIDRTSFHGTDAVALMEKVEALQSASAEPAKGGEGIGNPSEYLLSRDNPELFQELLNQAKSNDGEVQS